MKKIFALILALLLLGSTVACAESAKVLNISDPVLDMTMEGENVTLNFEGLTLRFAALSEDETPVIVLDVLGNDSVLFSAAAKLADGRVLLAANGLSHSYAAELPTGGTSVSVDFQLDSSVLEEIMAQAEISMDGTNITFHLPYTALNGLLKEILPQLEQVPNIDQMVQQIEELEADNSGVNLDGFVSMSFDRAQLSITPVEKGEAAEQPAAILDAELNMFDDGLDATLYVTIPEQGADPLACLEFSFRKNDDGVKGDLTLYLLSDSNRMKYAEIEFALGQTFYLEIEVVDTFDFEVNFDPATGALTISLQADELWLDLSAAVTIDEADVTACEFPAAVVEITEMGDEEVQQLTSEIQTAIMPLLGFVLPALMQSGLMG